MNNVINKFNVKFDNDLLTINHYKTHSQMLPYIGENYDKYKVLIISESHYVPSGYKEDINTQNWYQNPTSELITSLEGNTNTRDVIGNFFNKKGHKLFINLNDSLKKAVEGLGLEGVAWYNFYQKPAKHKTELNNPHDEDIKVAIEVFEGVINILKPSLIIFVSMNAFGALQKGSGGANDRKWNPELRAHQFKNFQIPILTVSHPNSPWWNRKHGEAKQSGKEKFERIIKERLNK
jgi:hypothetical protein